MRSEKGLSLREGKDLTIIATGLLCKTQLWKQQKCWQQMEIDAKVINIHTIKPLDEELVVAAAAKDTGKGRNSRGTFRNWRTGQCCV